MSCMLIFYYVINFYDPHIVQLSINRNIGITDCTAILFYERVSIEI